MNKTLTMGILGCGDFLRWNEKAVTGSARVRVKSLFDPDRKRAEKYAAALGGAAVADEAAVFNDPAIDLVCLFTPPWIRRGQVERAAAAGKHILTTKPLAPTAADGAAIVKAVTGAKVRCGVLYSRSGDAWMGTVKSLLEGGRFGRLALYRQDWIHHYPQWNNWALDPKKNGGPFMDAMIHNLNAARYLMGRPVRRATFFSDRLAHPALTCADTEAMKLDFESGAALLFITWAADLAVWSTEGNNREHIEHFYLVTDAGWMLTKASKDGSPRVRATREGQEEWIDVKAYPATSFDAFAGAIATGGPNPSNLPTADDACEDLRLLETAARA